MCANLSVWLAVRIPTMYFHNIYSYKYIYYSYVSLYTILIYVRTYVRVECECISIAITLECTLVDMFVCVCLAEHVRTYLERQCMHSLACSPAERITVKDGMIFGVQSDTVHGYSGCKLRTSPYTCIDSRSH